MTLPAGDYAVHAADGGILAAVERKTLDDLANSLANGTLAYQLQRFAEVPGAPLAQIVGVDRIA